MSIRHSDLTAVVAVIDTVLRSGARPEVLELLALSSGWVALARERVRELRIEATVRPPRDLTVSQACKDYPISRSFLYERGEQLGIARRLPGARKLIVLEVELRAYLEGRGVSV